MTLKNKILTELREEKNTSISGQFLAEKFGVSRNAIWKTINSLKDEGFVINSSTNKGYQLASEPDKISREDILSMLDDNIDVLCFKSIDSTNNEAKRLISDGKKGSFLIISESQTGGRGRNGKNFYSPQSTGLYMSLAVSMNLKLESAVGITSFASVCVVKAIQDLTGLECKIKWVNDIYLDGKKVCGILSEAVSDFESGTVTSIIIGIGVNLKTTQVPDELKDIVGFINSPKLTKNALASEITKNILSYDSGSKEYMEEYRKHSMVIGKNITYLKNGEWFNGKAISIDDDGALLVITDDGKEELLKSGEISLRVK